MDLRKGEGTGNCKSQALRSYGPVIVYIVYMYIYIHTFMNVIYLYICLCACVRACVRESFTKF
jgi:hypothetical protein